MSNLLGLVLCGVGIFAIWVIVQETVRVISGNASPKPPKRRSGKIRVRGTRRSQ